MSTSSERAQRQQQQQVYYGGQTSQQQQSIQRIGSTSSSSAAMRVDPHHRGEHQIVVVSGNSNQQQQCITNCVPSYHSSNCECPSCESKLLMSHSPTMDHQRNELYSYLLPADEHGGENDDEEDEDGIVREFLTESGDRHVVIMGKNEPDEPMGVNDKMMFGTTGQTLSVQERIRRQKLSEAARNRYALLSEEEKRAVTERRWRMRQRKKQKEQELEELEAILRATNDITDDLVPIDEASLQRKRAKISRYQSMSMEERRLYNQKRRLRQLGLPENIEEIPQEKLEKIKKHISDVNSRKAEAARQRYHRMSPAERKIYNRRRTESFRKRRVEEEKLLSTPAGQITPEALEKAQSIMLRNAKRAEQARLRYQKKQQEKGVVPKRQRKPKQEVNIMESAEPNLDQILDSIERDVVRKTEEAKQALKKKELIELKKEKEEPSIGTALQQQQQQFLAPIEAAVGTTTAGRTLNTAHVVQQQIPGGQNIVQYVQVPSQGVQNGFIIADKFVQLHTTDSTQFGPQYALIQEGPPGTKFEGNSGTSYYPVQIIQQDASSSQRPSSSGTVLGGQPTRIEIVQPTIITTSQGNFEHLTTVPASVGGGGGGHIIHYNTSLAGGGTSSAGQPQYAIQIEQPQMNSAPSNRSPIASTSHHHRRTIVVESSPANMSPMDHKLAMQKAKRAERARRRYHEMSVEARHEFNAKRAQALKMARLRDEELCRLGDEFSLKGEEPDENLRMAIEQARSRRSKRAEAARIKYQKMTNEQRKEHNTMRDSQRRQRKRELEDTVTILKQ